MKHSAESQFREIMDGSNRSPSAAVLRAGASLAEPIYAAVMRLRNTLYGKGILTARSLGRPTISVGNITTGGTGKTPLVQWIYRSLAGRGKKPAILMRGYRKGEGKVSDEEAIYAGESMTVIADPNRQRGATAALSRFPATDVFILDDGMQHRSAARDFELVAIHAAEPFGFGHVFPRGMLREPMAGLRRASAFMITHADEADTEPICKTLAKYNPTAAIFQCNHVIEADLTGKRYFAFTGIGSPASFFRRLNMLGGEAAGVEEMDDHHDYREPDIVRINAAARAVGANILITTAKDWVKLDRLAGKFELPVMRADLKLHFRDGDDEKLLELIRHRLRI